MGPEHIKRIALILKDETITPDEMCKAAVGRIAVRLTYVLSDIDPTFDRAEFLRQAAPYCASRRAT